ncbi:MAG: DUF1499 domain-containing protein [Gammaproteobacteria bacterium]|nr:DUF1499 domain-containing protein [Gammaproteobacteria bacterium]
MFLLSAFTVQAEKMDVLKICPDKPNCVSSQASRQQQQIAPIVYIGDQVTAIQNLKQLMLDLPRVQLVSEKNHYLHFSVTTAVFRFVDDVEFIFDDTSKVIHVRSASRVGYSDMGVNRKRVENIRQLFQTIDAHSAN